MLHDHEYICPKCKADDFPSDNSVNCHLKYCDGLFLSLSHLTARPGVYSIKQFKRRQEKARSKAKKESRLIQDSYAAEIHDLVSEEEEEKEEGHDESSSASISITPRSSTSMPRT